MSLARSKQDLSGGHLLCAPAAHGGKGFFKLWADTVPGVSALLWRLIVITMLLQGDGEKKPKH